MKTPPKWNELPQEIQDQFTLNGKIPVVDKWYDDTFNSSGKEPVSILKNI